MEEHKTDDEQEIEKVLKNRKKINRVPGVYLLFNGDTVVYVGKSLDPEKRIGIHLTTKKDVDSYYIYPCSVEDLDEMESKYILKYLPKYNKMLPKTAGKVFRPVGKLVSPKPNRKLLIPCIILNNKLHADFSQIGGVVQNSWDKNKGIIPYNEERIE